MQESKSEEYENHEREFMSEKIPIVILQIKESEGLGMVRILHITLIQIKP